MKRKNPSPPKEDILKARLKAGLTQREAAQLVHAGLTSWQNWEYGDRTMPPAVWELFLLKTRVRMEEEE